MNNMKKRCRIRLFMGSHMKLGCSPQRKIPGCQLVMSENSVPFMRIINQKKRIREIIPKWPQVSCQSMIQDI